MKDVTIRSGRVIVRPAPDDALDRVKRLRLREKVMAGGTLTPAERDLVQLALLQRLG